MNYLTLGELTNLIKTTLQSALSNDYWIIAEIAKINYHYNSGHCYIDLVEKQEDTVIAQMRATILHMLRIMKFMVWLSIYVISIPVIPLVKWP
jgi:exonuclease VII large subunit